MKKFSSLLFIAIIIAFIFIYTYFRNPHINQDLANHVFLTYNQTYDVPVKDELAYVNISIEQPQAIELLDLINTSAISLNIFSPRWQVMGKFEIRAEKVQYIILFRTNEITGAVQINGIIYRGHTDDIYSRFIKTCAKTVPKTDN